MWLLGSRVYSWANMRPLISEFSFGYALTEEIVRGKNKLIKGAPIFPTQNQEGQQGGYDVELPLIGLPIFLQFKLSDYLQRSSAKEWNLFNGPYYRMHLRPIRLSEQHNLLLEWDQHGNEVFYVAPEFHTQDELNRFYLLCSIVNNSAFFRPSAIGLLPDEYEHYVVYQRGSITGWLCSDEPRQVRKAFLGEQFEAYFSQLIRENQRELNLQYFINITIQLVDFLEQKKQDIGKIKRYLQRMERRPIESQESVIGLYAYIARTYFDAQLVIFRYDENQAQQ